MLKGLTSTFKDGCNNVELTYKEYVKLDNDIIPVKATLKDDVYENGNFIGTFILKEIQFETDATYEFRNKEFEYYKEVDGESIKIGTFISTDITINDTTEIVKVVGMDYGLKTQIEYTSALDYASGTITLKDVWNECCELSGLESGIDDFANSDFIVDSDQFSGTGATIRDVFKGIAMSSGSFVKVMNDDKVYLIFNEFTSEVEELEIDGSASVDDVFKIDELTELDGNTTQETSILPSGYTQVDYIESTGTQYINTGVIPTANTKIDIDFMYLGSVYNGWTPLYGERTISTGGNFALYIYKQDGRLSPNYGTFDPGVSSTQTISNNVKYNVKTDGGNFYLDDTLISSCSTSSTFNSSDRSIWLFDIQQQNGTPQLRGMKARIYRCKFYESTTLIRDLIPCYRNSDNVIGMYDLVNDTFYNNIGTGTFNYAGIPNPNNPREINVVSGRQEVSVVGKNLLPNNNATQTINGITFTKNDNGSITLSGTSNAVADYYLVGSARQYVNLGLPTGTYNLNGVSNGSLSTYMLYAVVNRNGTLSYYQSTNTTGLNISVQSGDTFRIFIRVLNSQTPNTTIYPQLEKGSTATEYEEYKGQSYEINLGKNLLPNTNTTQVLNNITFTKNDDDSIKMNGTANANTSYRINTLGNELSLPAGTYTISTGNNLTSGITLQGWHSTATNFVTIQSSSNKASFTLTSDVSNVRFQIFIANGTQISNLTIYPMLEKGSQATSYSLYKTPIELCKIGDYQDFIKKGIGKNLFNGVLELGSYYNSGGKYSISINYRNANFVKVKPNTTYTFSINGVSQRYCLLFYDKNETFLSYNYSLTNGTFTTPDNCYNLNFRCFDVDFTNDYANLKVQLEYGSNATQFEPYNSKGKWLLHKEIGKVVLNGSEEWIATGTQYTGLFSSYITVPTMKRQNIFSGDLYSNYFTEKEFNIQEEGLTKSLQPLNYDFLIFRIGNDKATNIDSWKSWLSTHNTTVYYVLATPTTTEITDSELISQLNAIELLEGLNNISITSNDLTGKLKLTYYNNEFDIIEDYVELEDKRDTHPWTCLRLGMSNVEGENVDYIDEDLVAQYGENWLILNDNPFAYNQEKRQQLIMNIFNQIKAFGYSAFVSKVAFKPYLTSGDVIHFRNREKELVKSIVLRYTHSGEQITLEAPSETSATVNYIYPLGAIDIAKQTQIIVDKDSVRIDSLTSQTQTIQDDLRQNYYTSTQINELVQTAETGLTNTFSEAGGNNIFRNTGLWFATSDSSNPYEFWNGVVVKQKEEKASNMSAMLLQNGNVSQEQLVPNGRYTISFKYNKPILLATAKVYINDTEYVLSATEDTEFIQVIEVSSQHINIRFNSDVNNGCEIYDLMVNAGEVKLAYSQNQNETTTDTVNISKGITITSSDTDVKFKADSDGIRTLDNNNNLLTEFTDEGMKTKTAIIESKSQIVGTLWQEVGGQTWITRL